MSNNIFPCVHRPSICPSRYLLLNHWAKFNQTSTSLSPHGRGVRDQHYFSVQGLTNPLPSCPGQIQIWLASDFLFNLPRKMYKIYREYCNSEPFSRCCGMPGKWLKLGFVRPCLCICHPSICLSHYLLLNHWVEFNQTCYMRSPHGKGVQEQVCPSISHVVSNKLGDLPWHVINCAF